MSISPRFLDEIRNRLSLSDVIGKRVKVMRAGREFKACCPFHHEKTPSFTINDDKQFYHCFGCGAHGDVINFVMQHDNLSFIDTVEMLCIDAGLQMPKLDPLGAEKAQKAKGLHDLMDEAAHYFTAQLHAKPNADVLSYLNNRGVGQEVSSAFRVGYAPADRQALRAHLKAQGYNDKDMFEAGLLRQSEKSPEPYVFFRDRVMFPVIDRRGRVVAFGGRTLPEHMRPPSQNDFTPPKYLNSSDTPLFDKGRMLYGEAPARQAARDDKPVIVTEGYMDVIACAQGGFTGAVAPMGTALTEDQILLLWSMIPSENKVPILCFDGDNAGRKAAMRSCERVLPLLKAGHSIAFAFLPDGQDPDSLIKEQGAAAFQSILDQALPLFDFIWNSTIAGRPCQTPEARAALVQALENQVKSITDREVQIHYQAQMRERISQSFFQRHNHSSKQFTRARSNTRNSYAPSARAMPAMAFMKPKTPVFRDIHLRALIAALLNHPFIYDDIEEYFGQLPMPDKRVQDFCHNIIAILDETHDFERLDLHEKLKAQGFEKEISDILNESVYVHAGFAAPSFDSEEILPRWLELRNALQGGNLQREMRENWKEAFRTSNQDDEDRLISIMSEKNKAQE